MSIEKTMDVLKALDQIIQQKRRGDAKTFSAELGISRRTFFRLIILLRQDCGAPVIYNRKAKFYYYDTSGSLVMRFVTAADREYMTTLK